MSYYTLVPRKTWAGSDPPQHLARLRHPVEAVYFAYVFKDYHRHGMKESPGPTPSHDQTLRELNFILRGDLRKLEDLRFKYLMEDVALNMNEGFLLGNDGCVYEARGWDCRPFLPVKYSVPPSFHGIFITFIGDFREFPPSEAMFKMRERFLLDAVREGYVRRRFTLVNLGNTWKTNLNPSILKY